MKNIAITQKRQKSRRCRSKVRKIHIERYIHFIIAVKYEMLSADSSLRAANAETSALCTKCKNGQADLSSMPSTIRQGRNEDVQSRVHACIETFRRFFFDAVGSAEDERDELEDLYPARRTQRRPISRDLLNRYQSTRQTDYTAELYVYSKRNRCNLLISQKTSTATTSKMKFTIKQEKIKTRG